MTEHTCGECLWLARDDKYTYCIMSELYTDRDEKDIACGNFTAPGLKPKKITPKRRKKR